MMTGLRQVSLAGASFTDILPDLQMLGLFALVIPPIGYMLFRFTEQRARRTGSLGQY